MKFHVIPVEDIHVPKDRQRRYFDEQKILELASSITENGLIQPVVIREGADGYILVAGERRLRALDIVWGYGEKVYCNNFEIPERAVPCVYLGEIDEVDAYEIELEENVQRMDLDWKEKAIATDRLFTLRKRQAAAAGMPEVKVADLAREIHPESTAGKPDGELGDLQDAIAKELILARNMANPVVHKASSKKEALKNLRRFEETKLNEEVGRRVGATFSSAMHTLLQGDCLEIMSSMPGAQFDVILTDPPYGMGADDFGDSDGKTAGAHRYSDSYETWVQLFERGLAGELARVAKPAAHLYTFCDIERFAEMKLYLEVAGWKVFRTPLIWVNPTAMRAPWPEHGPQRKWQMILFAIRGDKRVTRLYSDVITYPSDVNLGHQAQKPVALYTDLLRRSIKPGDSVLDPFCGTGTIFGAAHELKVRGTGIELDTASAGIAATRLKELK